MLFLGIEIGGTKLQLGVSAGDGSPLVGLETRQVDPREGAAGILKNIETAGRRLVQQHEVAAIGIGFGGPVDSADGRVVTSHQISGWDDFPLLDWCRRTFQLPAVLANDCDAAALAEARFGAGRGSGTVFYVTVGTGVGGGLVIDGRLHGAGRPAVAEIGHLRPGFRAVDAHLTVESLASGRGIEAAAQTRLNNDPPHPLAADLQHGVSVNGAGGDRPSAALLDADDALDLMSRCGGNSERLTARMVAEAAADGNGLALHVFGRAVRSLGWAVAQAVTLIAPEVVVVGGGVSLAGEELFFRPLREAVQQYVFPPLADSYHIAPAELEEQVVVHGALALAAECDWQE